PKSSLKRQQLNQKKPYFIATIFSLVAVVLAYAGFYYKIADIKREALATITTQVDPLKEKEKALVEEENRLKNLKQQVGQLSEWMGQRFFWADALAELRRVLIQAEAARKEAMGVENGVWIESFTSATPGLTAAPEQAQQEAAPAVNMMYYQRLLLERYGLRAPGAAPATEGEPSPAAATPKTAAASTNEISVI